MAQREVVILELTKNENIPGTVSVVGECSVPNGRDYRFDDTVGPLLHFVFDESESTHLPTAPSMHPEDFSFVRVRIYDATLCQLNATVFERTLAEYGILTTYPIFGRYRTPFKQLEGKIGRGENLLIHSVNEYKGNPNYHPHSGDRIIVDLLSPWKIIPDASTIKLQVVELNPHKHIGPEIIKVE